MSITTRRALRANIVSWDGGGLGTDIDVITRVLENAGCQVSFKGRRHRRPYNRAHSLFLTAGTTIAQRWAVLNQRHLFDVNFFIESIFPEYLSTARVNCLFGNPEWFRDGNLEYLSSLDYILCKTPSSVVSFHGLPVVCRNIGFTSPDKRLPGHVRHGPIRCIHLAGQSALKGTEAVIEAWSHHPEWPELTIVRRSRGYGGEAAPPLHSLPNVKYLTDYISEEQLRQLQNDCEVHVIPSQAEGYGHVIGEAMGCAAVVITTDAPPMNELVTPERGILIRVARSEPMRRSMRSYIDVPDLEAKLQMVFAMSPAQRTSLSLSARAWYESQHLRFQTAVRVFLSEIARDS